MSTLLHYLSDTVATHPERAAVIDGGRQLSYRELDARSGALAAELVRRDVRPGDRVGIHLGTGADLVVAVWSVLKTGAAYVPLDLSSPAARLRRILDGVAPAAVITAGDTPAVDGYPVQTVDVRGEHEPGPLPAHPAGPDDPAYLLHTSGSTGTPKGVVLTHRNATAFVDWATDTFDLNPADRVAGHAPPHFDLSVFDLFGTVRAAATLVPVPQRARVFPAELAAFLRDSGATVLYCVPSALTMLTRSGAVGTGELAALQLVLFAGEPCPVGTLRAMVDLLPGARFANLYGPTETNVCTYHEVDPALDLARPVLPIGRPITAEVETLVLAGDGRPAAIGEPGELHVGGPIVAAGYWGDPAQTAARFVPHPDAPDRRLYRTGDQVVRQGDGLLYFRGRIDRQVKTRGHRVELDEVETALRDQPEVVDAAVFAVPDETVTNLLVAVVTTGRPTTPARLRRACATRLPSYMLPSTIHLLDALPLTSTGKIDRRALAERFTVSPTL